MPCVEIHVKGKVQGVYFRAATREQAGTLGLYGFVRNEPDGSVYVQVEGDPVSVEKMIAWCRKGPSRAQVTEIISREIAPGHFTDFIIQR